MRAVVMTGRGDADVLELQEVPKPEPGPGEISVRVAASGVNRADLLQRRGRYPVPPGYSEDVLGLEYAGVVDSVGEGVDHLADLGALSGETDLLLGVVDAGDPDGSPKGPTAASA